MVVLTDEGRVLVLDQRRLKLVSEVGVRGLQVLVSGEYEFSLVSETRPNRTYRCAGGDNRAEEWAARIRSARERLLA